MNGAAWRDRRNGGDGNLLSRRGGGARRAASPPAKRIRRTFPSETSDFIRFNQGKVRQPGNVVQCYVDVDLIDGARHASHRLSLSGDLAADTGQLRAALAGLRAALPELDPDPHLLVATDVVVDAGGARGIPASGGGCDRRAARSRARGGPRGAVRRRAGVPRLRELVRPAQLARGDVVQPAVEPVPPRRQGREIGAVGLRLGCGRARGEDGRGPRAARAHRKAREDARPRQVPRAPDARGDGGHRGAAVLGRIFGPRARDQAEQPQPDARRGRRRRAARPARRRSPRRSPTASRRRSRAKASPGPTACR